MIKFCNGKCDNFLMFLDLWLKLLPAIIRPEVSKAKQPPMPPNGIVAGKPTTDTGEPKLTLEITVETIPQPPQAPKL